MNLCFATNNTHKIEEIKAVLPNSVSILSLADIGCFEELPEERDTLEGNSLQKADYVFQKYKVACFADDTGLEVEALNGEPGVYSARYAGAERNPEANMDLLLKKLEGKENRKAQFRTVVTLIWPSGVVQFDGVVKGIVLSHRKGKGGFGYDPVFLPDGFSKTLAEMSMEEKNEISHRAKATQKLVEFLNQFKIQD